MSVTPRENGQNIQERKDKEREAQMDNKHIKRCLYSLVTREKCKLKQLDGISINQIGKN